MVASLMEKNYATVIEAIRSIQTYSFVQSDKYELRWYDELVRWSNMVKHDELQVPSDCDLRQWRDAHGDVNDGFLFIRLRDERFYEWSFAFGHGCKSVEESKKVRQELREKQFFSDGFKPGESLLKEGVELTTVVNEVTAILSEIRDPEDPLEEDSNRIAKRLMDFKRGELYSDEMIGLETLLQRSLDGVEKVAEVIYAAVAERLETVKRNAPKRRVLRDYFSDSGSGWSGMTKNDVDSIIAIGADLVRHVIPVSVRVRDAKPLDMISVDGFERPFTAISSLLGIEVTAMVLRTYALETNANLWTQKYASFSVAVPWDQVDREIISFFDEVAHVKKWHADTITAILSISGYSSVVFVKENRRVVWRESDGRMEAITQISELNDEESSSLDSLIRESRYGSTVPLVCDGANPNHLKWYALRFVE